MGRWTNEPNAKLINLPAEPQQVDVEWNQHNYIS